MKRSELEYIRDQVMGGNSDAPNGNNLVGAINQILNTYDEADEWGVTPSDADWQEAHDDFQYILADLSNQLATVTGNDGTLEDENGNKLADLPNAATSATNTTDIPNNPN